MYESNLKRAFGIISPMIIYLLVERCVGFLINFVYLYGQLEEDTVWSDALEEQLYEKVYALQTEHTLLMAGIVALICIGIFCKKLNKEWMKRDYRIEPVASGWKKYICILCTAIGFTISVNLLINALFLFKYDVNYSEISRQIYSEPMILQIAVIGFLMPICEECLFRGLIYERVSKYGSERSALITTSLLFAFFHGSYIQIIYAFAFSMLMIYTYRRTGLFRATVCFHIVSNLCALVLRQFPLLSTMGYSIGIVCFFMVGLWGLYLLKHGNFYKKVNLDLHSEVI